MGKEKARTAAETAVVPFAADAAVDVFAGIASATCAAPFIMTVDKAVTEAAAGTRGLGPALVSGFSDMVLRPHKLLMRAPFWMVAGVYGSTYVTANLLDTACERTLDPADKNTSLLHGAIKLLGTTAVNMGAGVAKDAAFAKMFGAQSSAPPPVPRATLGLFAFRDLLTIGAAFTVPQVLATALVSSGTMDESHAAESAQLMSPIGMQLILTPLHLLALSMYNEPAATPAERAAAISRTAPSATLARMGRFGAAYGVGGLMNTALTHRGRDLVLQRYGPPAGAELAPRKTPPEVRYRSVVLYGEPLPDGAEAEAPRKGGGGEPRLTRRGSTHFGYYPVLTRTLSEIKLGNEEGGERGSA